ncbi:carbamoyl-phosphate synthase, large subunit [Spirochaeta thermophila DSM 6578]|uniref:Carbamoyl phosphate synthase large chain n=1 Tax=Winmispira thermophila (strain ATCC 700085 / DSM 6578 / Z-1203) TaxID=869211 RepID=G0G9Z7_WINT7|nr:carbamoyl-phosphate synthase large subunit [Spirochaeta thermophila]AEJ61685.1 carbamoyl-phosphate synthase, large subunit [Spirochaeta thermophila DSM 6578]
MPARKDISSVLIIGSGPIVIGQACEFDYSGTQAVKALKEEGYRVILVNPNPATIMTTPGLADVVYMEPLEVPYLEEIIRKERPDALLPTMGGQTGLNLSVELYEAGVLDRYGVELIGANVEAIRKAEDRGKFKEVVTSIGLDVPRSAMVKSLQEGRKVMEEIGLPLVIRPSFTLGGKGGSIASTPEDFELLLERALLESPVHEALIEESLLGWKEFELEVMRDHMDNAVIVCSIENIDPMGVHTGDSVTVAPIQTLSDWEYQKMRTAGIEVLRAIGVDCGGSNVQFAVRPDTGRMVVIEMNPRVSRSSALASKATGFPIARCAAKLAVGYTLDEVINEITGKTVSCFEPALDYVAVKVPRFEFDKFPSEYEELGTQMKSIGESLALGRTFAEAFNKAWRAAEYGFEGLQELRGVSDEDLERMLHFLHPRKFFAIYTVLRREGRGAVPYLAEKTKVDPWFLFEMARVAEFENELERERTLTPERLLQAKQYGLTDRRIASLVGMREEEVSAMRDAHGFRASYHFVDTCAGEFEAQTPYFYSTYGEIDEGGDAGEESVIIIASGPNRIGQGLEFDTCCTLATMAYRELGKKAIMVNSNPETVSTDFNVSDRLYLEPLSPEDVGEILKKEKTKKVVVQLGGQTPLNMAEALEAAGAEIVGTPVRGIKEAEDRGFFADLVRRVGLNQPANRAARTLEEVRAFAEEIGYPVLLRPSFVLGGKSMFIAFSPDELEEFLRRGVEISPERPVLVDQFLEDAFEYDVDAVSDGENVYIGGIMQHIEAAGIHSGDSACVFPPYKSNPEVLTQMKDATVKIARALGVEGFLNIQYAVKDDVLYVLEVNPRASRTVPYLSKASGVNMVKAAVRVWEGEDLKTQGLVGEDGVGEGRCVVGWAVKEAMFSFDRFRTVDPILGPEMKSTGEVIGIGRTFGEAFAKAQLAAGNTLPTKGRVFVSVHDADKATILPIVKELVELGFEIAATRGTADFLYRHGIFSEVLLKLHEGHPNVVDHMRRGRIHLVINTPLGRFSQRGDEHIRIEALRRKIPYTTTTSAAKAAVEGIKYLLSGEVRVQEVTKFE